MKRPKRNEKNQELINVLENIVNKNNIINVLSALTEICFNKAKYLESTWNEVGIDLPRLSIDFWESSGKEITIAADKIKSYLKNI